MFHIKICGITGCEDAKVVADAGADAIGLNFYKRSPRCVTVAQAEKIVATLPHGMARVGVFVNRRVETICKTAEKIGLDWVQLHGDERPEELVQLSDTVQILRAFRLRDEGVSPVLDDIAACRHAGRVPNALLIDAFDAAHYGGTGRTVAWPLLRDERIAGLGLPIVLAGGLTHDNVAHAILTAGPAVVAVDTASGVESSPGVKDPEKVRRFVEQARCVLEDSAYGE